jgi:hypothetical protein
MGIFGQFQDEQHRARFAARARETAFGGIDRSMCGARTRGGTLCRAVPILEGKGRCLRHAGPHAARAYRERQRQQFLSGKISAEEWNRAEARRAANRLTLRWQKDPWLPGRTIDLGDAEDALRAMLRARGVNVDVLPPAVADWLRWRYRRTQIDRQSESAWLRVLNDQLPERVRRAGPRPASGAESQSETGLPLSRPARTWTPDAHGAETFSKRHNPDQPRAPKVRRGKGYLRPGRPRTQAASDDELDSLMALYREHRAIVAPMWKACRSEGDRLALLRALRDYLAAPDDPAYRDRWFAAAGRGMSA